MFKGKFFNLILIAAIFSALTKSNLALTSCNYGSGNSYSAVNCYTGETNFCQKQEITYQGSTATLRSCAATCTENTSGSVTGGYTFKTWCCTSDKCNFSSTIASNKLLTGISIIIATLVAFLKIN